MGRAGRAGGRRVPVWPARPALAVAWRPSEIADYLPLLGRSGLGPSFPAWPIGLLSAPFGVAVPHEPRRRVTRYYALCW